MSKKLPQRDPISAAQRKATAARRVGQNAQCTYCNETRPEALIANSKPLTCAECQRKSQGKRTVDTHHVAMRANNPATVQVPVNDHRAVLNVAQHGWPKRTRENPDGSPLLAAAGCIRGFMDYLFYLVEKFLHWTAEMLEELDSYLIEKLGPQWWLQTPLKRFVPQGASNGKS
jgi:hypothetical protein